MLTRLGNLVCLLCLLATLPAVPTAAAFAATSWNGVLRDAAGKPVGEATVRLRSKSGDHNYTSVTSENGNFAFNGMAASDYELSVEASGNTWHAASPVTVRDEETLTTNLQVLTQPRELRLLPAREVISVQGSGGERLSSGEVSSLPLNARDFSKLLLLAAGTMTDANGAANFTQQFAVNGQRGTATVFALDGFDTTDPEMGGATFSNFNVDAIQEVQANSGVMPAEIGHGAASFTNVVTKSGTNQVHGSFFEFARNAAFDARNYFDHKSVADERRIPPFVRNEFGFTNGGPVVLPQIYNGRDRTFYFGQYQGFRQVLGTTQVFPVPTAAERQGIDTAHVSRRYADRSGEPGHRAGARPLSSAQRSAGSLRRSHLRGVFKDLHAHRPVFGARRSPHFRQGLAADPVQPEPGDRAADQSRSDCD